jgi:hypothetical protein
MADPGLLRAHHGSHAMGLLKSFISDYLRPRAAKDGPPPHAVKQAVIRTYARRHGTRILVETGTFLGDMVEAMKLDFEHVYSIELSPQLFDKAKARFHDAPNVTLIQGDSGHAIKDVLSRLKEPALFWLDGHWSDGITARGDRDTPVREELDAILATGALPHVILIDDARLFGADPAYPTIEELRKQVSARRPQLELAVDTDIIRIAPC